MSKYDVEYLACVNLARLSRFYDIRVLFNGPTRYLQIPGRHSRVTIEIPLVSWRDQQTAIRIMLLHMVGDRSKINVLRRWRSGGGLGFQSYLLLSQRKIRETR